MTGGIDIDALKAALAVAEATASDAETKASEAEARAANAAAKVSDAEAEIAFLKLTIEKLRREMYGWRSERKQRLLDQLELQLDELEASATEDELAAEQAVAGTTEVKGFTWRKPARKPFLEHLPRERVVVPPPLRQPILSISDALARLALGHRLARAEFDERMLRDIGIRRDDVVVESTKPFWRT